MNDIEKMKKEFEQKVKYAELENQLNEGLEPQGIKIHVVGTSCTQKGKLHAYFTSLGKGYLDHMTAREAKIALTAFPVTEKARVYVGHDEYRQMDYRCAVSRSPRDYQTQLEIEWISGEYDLSVKMGIDTQDNEVMQYFQRRTRKLTDTEVQLYLNGRTRWNKQYRENFPYLSFNCGEVVHFQGGSDLQASDGHAGCLVAEIYSREYPAE